MSETRNATLREFCEATAHYADDEVFRWYQASTPGPDGTAVPTITYRLTFREVRRTIGFSS